MSFSARIPMWRTTPPALFPPLLGLFGLALAWRRAAEAFGIGSAPGDLILGAVTLIYLFAAGSYVAKLWHRPGVLREDLGNLPGRAGLAAASVSAMVLAAGLVPIAPGLARGLLWAALGLHLLLALGIAWILVSGPQEQRRVTPVWHITFVGFLVSPAAAVPLGLTWLAQGVLVPTLAAASGIFAVSLVQLARSTPPPPLRPLLAIHLAPMSLFGTGCLLLGWPRAAMVFAALATGILIAMLIRARWMTQAGFSPLWGAFTFPITAFAGLMLGLAPSGPVFGLVGAVTLVLATGLVPWIGLRIFRMWPPGTLAAKTNAAVA